MTPQWLYCKSGDTCLGVLVENTEDKKILSEIFNDSRNGKVQNLTLVAAKDMLKKAKAEIEKQEAKAENTPKLFKTKSKKKVSKKKIKK